MPSVFSGVRKMNWYFLSSRAFLMMLSSEILLKICTPEFHLKIGFEKYLLFRASIKTSNSSRTLKGGVIAFQSARIRETLKQIKSEIRRVNLSSTLSKTSLRH